MMAAKQECAAWIVAAIAASVAAGPAQTAFGDTPIVTETTMLRALGVIHTSPRKTPMAAMGGTK